METFGLPALKFPEISGDAGIGELVASMRDPAYLRLLGKSIGTGIMVGTLAKRLPPQLAFPLALIGGVYLGLEIAAWMEEDARKAKGPVIDATISPELVGDGVTDNAPALEANAVGLE